MRLNYRGFLTGLVLAAGSAAAQETGGLAPLPPLPPLGGEAAPPTSGDETATLPPLATPDTTPPAPGGGQTLTPLPPLADPAPDGALPPLAAPSDGALPPLAAPPVIPPRPFDDRERLRAVQTRLNALGCETGTPDGAMGRNTRRGYRAFLDARGLAEDRHPIDGEAFWRAIYTAPDEVICEPPAQVPVNAATIEGRWTYATRCGRGSRMPGQNVTGLLTLEHIGGGRFTGALSNSQGLRANVSGRLRGRTVALDANFGFLFGRVQAQGTVADDAYVFYGRDSNGCRLSARKR